MSESHLRPILKFWIPHYNSGRPHMALDPGVPNPPPAISSFARSRSRHRRQDSYVVRAKSILGGLHHEYSLAPAFYAIELLRTTRDLNCALSNLTIEAKALPQLIDPLQLEGNHARTRLLRLKDCEKRIFNASAYSA